MSLNSSMTGGRRKRTMKKRTNTRRNKKRTRSNRRRSNKGGFVGILEQALVPFGLFALQKKMHNRKLTKTSKMSKKSRR
jgi:hypothetical protein